MIVDSRVRTGRVLSGAGIGRQLRTAAIVIIKITGCLTA